MQISRFRSHKSLPSAYGILVFTMAAGIRPAAAAGTPARLEKAVAVLNKLADTSGDGIRQEEIASADCVAVIPAFKKGAAAVGVSFGRGFISCRNGANWSAPGAVALEGDSLGVQIGGEKIDIVILSLDKERRAKVLSDRFTIGSDASAAWRNGKTAHGDPNAKILFFGHTKGAFAGFDLDGTTLKPDASSNKALYGKIITNNEIVEGAATPAVAQPFVSKLTFLLHHESATASNPQTTQ
ncbi:MAG TPA: lipid-binding SYLF domain-containing protein [Bryobacteraceae bacterium]|jgi:lipid-binding SYLF domain-containing protein|nr:lipid-binding SYLF domain-containing protein [Bryobacteraceae bacterium]